MRRCTADWQGNNVFSSSLSLSLSFISISVFPYVDTSIIRAIPIASPKSFRLTKRRRLLLFRSVSSRKAKRYFSLLCIFYTGREGKALLFF